MGKWTRPIAPPPPMFLGEKEKNLVKQVNDEVIERVVGQQVLYFPVDIEHTNFHSLYNAAIVKSFLAPVRVYALVNFEGQKTNRLMRLKYLMKTKKINKKLKFKKKNAYA